MLLAMGLTAYAGETAINASQAYTPLKVYDMAARVDESSRSIAITIDLNMADMHLSRDREMVFTPMIISENGADSLELSPIIVAGRNRYYWHMRNPEFDAPGTKVYRAGSKEQIGRAHV